MQKVIYGAFNSGLGIGPRGPWPEVDYFLSLIRAGVVRVRKINPINDYETNRQDGWNECWNSKENLKNGGCYPPIICYVRQLQNKNNK